MRTILALLWIGLLVLGWTRLETVVSKPDSSPMAAACGVAATQSPDLTHVATRDLPKNWRLRPGDLANANTHQAWDGLVGRYMACAVTAGKAVEAADVWRSPRPAPADGTVMAQLALPASIAEEANAGSEIIVFEGPRQVLRIRVAAVRCDGTCFAFVNPAETERFVLDRLDQTKAGIVLSGSKARLP